MESPDPAGPDPRESQKCLLDLNLEPHLSLHALKDHFGIPAEKNIGFGNFTPCDIGILEMRCEIEILDSF